MKTKYTAKKLRFLFFRKPQPYCILLMASLVFFCFSISRAQNIQTNEWLNANMPVLNANALSDITQALTPKQGNKSVLLHDNGPFINVPGYGIVADSSVVQVNLGMLGVGARICDQSPAYHSRVADEFDIDTGYWIIDSIVFFSFEMVNSTGSTVWHYNIRVWNGQPDTVGSSVVWGDEITNRLIRTSWTGAYRVGTYYHPDTNKHIMRDVIGTPGLVLSPGTYWLDWQGEASPNDNATPFITINGVTTTGNARKRTTGSWSWCGDPGTLTPQGLPFLIYGYNSTVLPDIGVMGVMSPSDGILGTSETIAIGVQNHCNDSFIDYPIAYSVDGQSAVTEINPDTLVPSGVQTYVFTTPANLSAPGQHTIKVWTAHSHDVNRSNDTISVVVNNTASVTELPGGGHLRVWPNPATDRVYIQLVNHREANTGGGGKLPWLLTDLPGKVVQTGTIENDFTQIDISGLPTGMYILQVVGAKTGIKLVKE